MTRGTAFGWASAVAGLLLASWIVGYLAATGKATFDWGAATGAATAYGTLALALVTGRLVALTRADASGTLALAELAEREQEERVRALRRARIEAILDAVNQLVDASILAREVSSQAATAVPIWRSRLRSAIAVAGIPVKDGQLGSTELLTRPNFPLDNIEDQAEAARRELVEMLGLVDRAQ